jgi:hypothetical protein
MEVCRAQFLLTEVGHGLDARNLETTATLKSDGGFELHTPRSRAAKYDPLIHTTIGQSCSYQWHTDTCRRHHLNQAFRALQLSLRD